MNLLELQDGDKALIYKLHGSGVFRKRIIEMGFIKGSEIKVIKKAPLQDPIQYEIMGYQVSLRRDEAAKVEVIPLPVSQAEHQPEICYNCKNTNSSIPKERRADKTINLVLVGNPNSGKTSIFNYISGSRENVGNYPGVTVEAKKAKFKYNGYTFNLVDLPGTYSISAYTPEEVFVREFIVSDKTDIVVNVVDSSNLERNLYLTTQLLDIDVPMVLALNMYDELEKSGNKLEYEKLGEMIGTPFVPTVGKKGEGMKQLLDCVIRVYENAEPLIRHIHINYGTAIEESIDLIEPLVEKSNHFPKHLHTRYIALKLLEKDSDYLKIVAEHKELSKLKEIVLNELNRIENLHSEPIENTIADIRYGFIKGALKETYELAETDKASMNLSERIDQIITHKYFGLPIFVFILWLMFYTTFYLGGYLMEWIEMGVEYIGYLSMKLLPNGIFQDLIAEGIIGGVGGVIVFMPNIVILFMFIALMEGTGYMARIAFIMDRLMHKVGLHGKSFIPLIMGFGCNVPAIMATRTLENKSDRILTMLIIPLMSCSARLPVYLLLITAFFPKNPALILLSIYLIGLLFATLFALLFKKLFFNKTEAPFVMELPPYRMPTLKVTMVYMWLRASMYLKKMGGIILIASIIIWFLGYFPRNVSYSKNYDEEFNKVEMKYEQIAQTEVFGEQELEIIKQEKINELTDLVQERELERHSKTYIGMMGRAIEPVMRPLGFDWRLSIGLLSGFPAKEVIISTMGVLFQEYELDPDNPDVNNPIVKVGSLQDRIASAAFMDEKDNGKPLFTQVSAFAFLIFVLFYFPCTAAVVAIHKEAGRFLWTSIAIVYTTVFAWLMAYGVNQIGNLFF